MSIKELEKAYSLLEKSTPLKGDCGRLCDHLCCRGGDGDGMLLFPGEDRLFEGKEGFSLIRNGERTLLVCKGFCNRKERPLACRLFPLFPLIYEEDGEEKIKVVTDPEFPGCPLASCGIHLENSFVRNVRLAGKILMRNERQKEFLKQRSSEILSVLEFRERMGG